MRSSLQRQAPGDTESFTALESLLLDSHHCYRFVPNLKENVQEALNTERVHSRRIKHSQSR